MRKKAVAARPRNRRGEGNVLRDQIVEAALAAVSAGGGRDSITLRSLARDIGIATTSIYAHFETMDEILKAAADRAFGELTMVLRQASAADLAPVARLAALVGAYAAFGLAQPAIYRLLFGTPLLATGRPIDGTSGGEAFGELSAAVAACIDAGLSRQTDAQQAATLLWVALHGYVALTVTLPDFPWPERQAFLEALVRRTVDLKVMD